MVVLLLAGAGALAYVVFGGDDKVDRTPVVRSAPPRPVPPPMPQLPVLPARAAVDPVDTPEAGPCGPGMEMYSEIVGDATRATGCASRTDGGRIKQGQWTLVDPKGFKLEGEYVDNLREGRWTAWYPSGSVFQYVNFLHDKKDGVWVQWSEDGRKIFEHSYRDDQLDGPSTDYPADGGYVTSDWRNGVRSGP